MSIDEFWSLIKEAGRRARSGPRGDYMDRYVAKLEQLLRERSPEEVVAFRDHFQDRLYEAYNWDQWGAAEVIGQGFCSDDWFEYFRCWLISMGREVYEQALADPDSLVEPASRPEVEGSCFFEDLLYVPYEVYEEMSGTEIPDYPRLRCPPDPPSGTKFRDDRSDLRERYPRLWARFGGEQQSRARHANHRVYVPRRWSQVDWQQPSRAPSIAASRREMPGHMEIDEFWSLIEETRRGAHPDPRDGYMHRFVAKLEQLLRERSPEEVFEFGNRFEDRIREALTGGLWDAAGLIVQSPFDDGPEWPLHWFDYFGGWLISMGRDVYEQALADPDSLVEPASRPGIDDWFLDELVCVPDRVYETMTGTEMPGYPDHDDPHEPPGTEQRDDKPALPRRTPKLWARFGTRR